MGKTCNYPVVFVHGMFGWGDEEGINDYIPYWGATTGSLVDYLNDKGYDTYAASVGPASSAWDRACELYARLVGGAVDYGKAHSERANHKRFGRYYEKPMFEGWSDEKKIHLIGHSFGGNTVRLLAHLLTYGDPEEVAAIKEGDKEVSELFTGGKQDLIASVVTICAPHNGTTTFLAANKFKIVPLLKPFVYNYIGIAGRSPAEGTIFDFHLEQYGMSDTPGKKDAYPLRRARKQYMKNSDNVEYDMSPEGAKKLNDLMEISPGIYYFSYSFNCVRVNTFGNCFLPTECDFPLLTYLSGLILLYNKIFAKEKKNDFIANANDGLVDLSSAIHPCDEPFIDYKDNMKLLPGKWHVMKTETGDHGTPIGLFASEEKTHDFYLKMLTLLKEVEENIENK